jgi:hypothetical protein
MTINEILKRHDLPPLPMRAWLELRHTSAFTVFNPTWALQYRWEAEGEEPILCGLELRKLEFAGALACLALIGRALMPSCDRGADDEERFLVFLLNPADPTVWEAVDSWLQARCLGATNGTGMSGSSVTSAALAALDIRSIEGEELESDLLAGELLEQIKNGQLGIRSGLELNGPIYFTIVETPFMCKSLQPADPGQLTMDFEHKANKLLLEGIAD